MMNLTAPKGRRFLAVALARGKIVTARSPYLNRALRGANKPGVRKIKVWMVGSRARVEGTFIVDAGGSSYVGCYTKA